MIHTLLYISISVSIGYVLYLVFYYMQMHTLVRFENGVIDAPHMLLILIIVGLVLSLF